MSCSVCSADCSASLCDRCASLVTRLPDATHVSDPFGFKGSGRSQIRDRQWLFKHAREVLAGDPSREDLESLRDRLPFSQRGKSLRNQIAKRLDAMSRPVNPVIPGWGIQGSLD